MDAEEVLPEADSSDVEGAPEEQEWGQLFFDIFFGMAAPVLCALFDPLVFRGWASGQLPGILRSVLGPVCGAGVLAMVCLMAWLAFGLSCPRFDAVLTGGMLAGALLAFGVGLVLLPFSVVGLFYYFAGVFGFIPFVTFKVYWRNMRLARAHARRGAGAVAAGRLALLGFVVVLAVSLAGWRVFETCLPQACTPRVVATEDN